MSIIHNDGLNDIDELRKVPFFCVNCPEKIIDGSAKNDERYAFAVRRFIFGVILLFLPVYAMYQYFQGLSHIGIMIWALLQLILVILSFAWGADILYYRDKKYS